MANEINLRISMIVEKGDFKWQRHPTQQIDQAAIGRGGTVQVIGTNEEVIDFGDVSTEGWCYVRNLDAANFVELGPETGGAMVAGMTLLAGEAAVFRLKSGVVWRAKADTASVKLDVSVFEN